MSNLVNIKLNGRTVSAESDMTIMEAAKQNGIYIPNLCSHPDQRVKAHCRICSVEVSGSRNLITACSTKVAEGMEIQTNTPKVREARRTILELIFADHPQDCLTCIRNGNCELRQLAARLGVSDIKGEKKSKVQPLDLSTTAIVRNPNKCIKCGRCSEVCHSIQEVGILYILNRSVDVNISPEYGKKLSEVDCVLCGQCVLACPVGAIHEKDDTDLVWSAIADSGKHVIVQVAPSVRVSLAEEFDMPIGSIETGRLVSALRALGFDRVFDTNFTADLTIIEEGNELLQRITHGGVLTDDHLLQPLDGSIILKNIILRIFPISLPANLLSRCSERLPKPITPGSAVFRPKTSLWYRSCRVLRKNMRRHALK